MGRNMTNALLSLFSKNVPETDHHQQPWLWDSCKNPKTMSFRAGDDGIMFKTVNSLFSDEDEPETPQSAAESSSSEFDAAAEAVETVVRGARTERDRLFFDPRGDSRCIAAPVFPAFKESVVMAMESEDPYVDFRRSMEEMVESGGIKEWDCLEELLGWYLRMNGKNNHGFIVEAFIDLLLNLNGGGGGGGGKNDAATVSSFSSGDSSFSDDSSDLA